MSTATPVRDPFVSRNGRRVLPTFSLAERDRRYARVRGLMRAARLDCLIAPPGDGFEAQASSRYLTQIGGPQGGAWAVLPLDGEATAIVATEREQRMWQEQSLEWPTDLRWGDRIDLLVGRLRELSLARGRIGVAGLADVFHNPDGVIPYQAWVRVQAALPNVSWVHANELLDRARVLKGAEEIAAIEHIVAADEAALTRMAEVARPGAEEADVWFAMADVLTRTTGDFPARLSLGVNGRPPNASNSVPLPIRLERGGVLTQEIDARFQGYRAQCNHAILVGRGELEATYREAMDIAIGVFSELLLWVRPGRTVGELLDEYVRLGDAGGGKAHGMMFHSCGLGNDRPRVGPGPFAHQRDWSIEPGWTFSIKPHVLVERTGVLGQIGEPITVTPAGAGRLGQRDLVPIVT